jgi:hypothetical protein
MTKLEALFSQLDQRTAEAIKTAMEEAAYRAKQDSHGKVPRHIEDQLTRIESELQLIREHYQLAEFNKTERYESTKKLVTQVLSELNTDIKTEQKRSQVGG